jgi:VWFA-related protein
MRSRNTRYFVLASAGLLAFFTLAQAPGQREITVESADYAPAPRITTEASDVDMEVVVRRPDGSPIAGLTRDNFRIEDDGEQRGISGFYVTKLAGAPERPAPGAAGGSPPGSGAAPARYLGLIFDDVSTEGRDLINARNAAQRFIGEQTRPGTELAIFTTSGAVEQDFTADAARVQAAVARIRAHPRAGRTQLECPRITPFEADLIVEHHDMLALQAVDAEAANCNGKNQPTGDNLIDAAVNELNAGGGSGQMALAQAQATFAQARGIALDSLTYVKNVVDAVGKMPGQRILVLATGGFISDTLENLQEAIVRDALRQQVTINALDARGLYTEGPGRPPDEVATTVGPLPLVTFFFEESSKLSQHQAEDEAAVQLAQGTGGLFFHDNNDLTLGFYRLGLAPELSYHLAFSPSHLAHDGKFHRLAVRLEPGGDPRFHGAVVQARRGYFAPAPETAADRLRQTMDGWMRQTGESSGVPVTVATTFSSRGVTAAVRFDVSRLEFVRENGRRRQQLAVIAGLFDGSGRFVTGRRGVLNLALSDATWKRYQRQGMSARLTLAAPAGRYRLRVVVGEVDGGGVSAFNRTVTIP